MDVELLAVGNVPLGLVSSSLIIGPGESVETFSPKQDVLISVCPSGRLIAFVNQFRANFVSSEDAPNLDEGIFPNYQNTFQGLIHVLREPSQPKPSATACVVIPVSLQLKSNISQISSVVMIGFNDGSIGAYSKTGKRIFCQQLYTDSVMKLSVMSQPFTYGRTSHLHPSSLIVLMKGGVVCIIDGNGLSEVIEHNVIKFNEDRFDDDTEPNVILKYKKFNLEQQSVINDVALIGPSTVSSFDYLREACVLGGHDTAIRSGPSPEARLIVVGEQHMIALFRVNKDAGTINVTEVVHEMASRMTSAVLGKLSQASGWFGWGGGKSSVVQTPTKPPEEKQQRTLNLSMSTNIPDIRRQVNSIVVSPIGNLAALVDGFGRVLLLDTVSLAIRRMWKGYREAQCGWLVVSDPSESQSRAQCLCIYLPRRGILEFWPVQVGGRVAAFSVGKNCHLLYSTQCVFGKDSLIKEMGTVCPSLGDTALLFCPDGRLMTFKVPFPALIKRSSPISHDSHLLMKLDQAINTGGVGLVQEVAMNVKSSQAMKEVVRYLLVHYNDTEYADIISRDLIMKVLNTAVYRSISNPTCTVPEDLHKHFIIVRYLCQFYFHIEDARLSYCQETTPTSTNKFEELLTELCNLTPTSSERIAQLLNLYFQTYEPVKRVTQEINLSDLIGCFDTRVPDIDCLLSDMTESIQFKLSVDVAELTPVNIKPSTPESFQLDLATFIFLPLMSVSSITNELLFKDSHISGNTFIYLLFKLWLSGILSETNPSILLQSLHNIITLILGLLKPDPTSTWNELLIVLSSNHLSGHALLLGTLCQHLMTLPFDDNAEYASHTKSPTDGEEEEEWETVTMEREQWAQLCNHLELLTKLALVTGVKSLQTLPPVLFTTIDEEEWTERSSLDVSKLKIKMFFEDERQEVCVTALESSGPALLGHCIAKSLVSCKIPAKIIAGLGKSTSGELQNIIHRLQALVRVLPYSLSSTNLLMYCAFQAAFQWNEDKDPKLLTLAIDYISYIEPIKETKGICGFLWHTLFEKELLQLFEDMKKKAINRDPFTSNLLWTCRSLINCLDRLSLIPDTTQDPVLDDIIQLNYPTGIQFLPAIVSLFPVLDTCLLKTSLKLLLQAEVILECSSPVNVFTYYDPIVQSWWKKGLYLSKGAEEQIGRAIIQKQTKFVNGAVIVLLDNKSPHINSNAVFAAVAQSQQSGGVGSELNQFTDIVFLLASLWGLSVDEVYTHWVANLLAAGIPDKGQEIFQCIHDKSLASNALLSVVGHLSLQLMNSKDKRVQSIVLAQTTPSLLEWMRKQKSLPIVTSLIKLHPLLSGLFLFLELLRPHCTQQCELILNINKFLKLLE